MAEKAREARDEESDSEAKAESQAKERPEHSKESGAEERRRHETEGGVATFQQKSASRREPRARRDENVVFVGKKPTMSYVLAVITQFSDGNSEVFVKARGRSISRAVDVVEVVRKKFMQDVSVAIETDTEVITDERNQRINVSTLSAKLFK